MPGLQRVGQVKLVALPFALFVLGAFALVALVQVSVETIGEALSGRASC